MNLGLDNAFQYQSVKKDARVAARLAWASHPRPKAGPRALPCHDQVSIQVEVELRIKFLKNAPYREILAGLVSPKDCCHPLNQLHRRPATLISPFPERGRLQKCHHWTVDEGNA